MQQISSIYKLLGPKVEAVKSSSCSSFTAVTYDRYLL